MPKTLEIWLLRKGNTKNDKNLEFSDSEDVLI